MSLIWLRTNQILDGFSVFAWNSQKNMPAGSIEIAKRAFVSELRSVGEAVGLNGTCKREGSDKAILDVCRRLAKVVHPDLAAER